MELDIEAWLRDAGPTLRELDAHLTSWWRHRAERTASLAARGRDIIWWPFTQHQDLSAEDVLTVDSRWGADLLTSSFLSSSSPGLGKTKVYDDHDVKATTFTTLTDACSAWWTQGLGHVHHPRLARGAAYATGRYGHLLHPKVVCDATVDASQALLDTVGGPDRAGRWASRVFWSDDGSTAVEVAIKMAFRLRARRRGDRVASRTGGDDRAWTVLSLTGSYHGDTLGAMDASPPSVFNTGQTPWHMSRSTSLPTPQLALRNGAWSVHVPRCYVGLEKNNDENDDDDEEDHDKVGRRRTTISPTPLASRAAAFCPSRRATPLAGAYRGYIQRLLSACDREGRSVGAAVLEPVLQGAGGMVLVDPLLQWVMVDECRKQGIPVIADEVFAGLFRLGGGVRLDVLAGDDARYRLFCEITHGWDRAFGRHGCERRVLPCVPRNKRGRGEILRDGKKRLQAWW